MADLSKLVNELSELTVLEAAELTKPLEEKWAVNATGIAMQEFISEADVATFEGWLRYIQGFDPSALTPEELAQWRAIFDEINKSSTPKVGLMKLRSLPGEHRYAVAIRRRLRSLADVVGPALAEGRIFRHGAARGSGVGPSQ